MSDTPFGTADVIAMERAAARAWPPRCIERAAGWQVRLSGGGTRRANSVLPLDYDGSSLDAAIDQVEAHYRGQKTRCFFQVVSVAQPHDLDAQLAARGYVMEEPCLLLTQRLRPQPMPDGVAITTTPTADWLAVYTEMLDGPRKAAASDVLAHVPAPRAFLLARSNGEAVSTALAVISPDGIAVVESVATRSAARRQGGGVLVMQALESWSQANGAHTAALQVVAANTPARKLYERRGYRQVGTYHYRWKDVG
jgi:N-acetylglutamate synthase